MKRTLLLSTAAVAAAGALAVPATAPAASWNCSASALLGQPAGTPVTANVGALACKAASGGVNLPALPVPLSANVLSARTTLDGASSGAPQQRPSATGEVLNLGIGSLPDLPIALPTAQIPPTVITVPTGVPGQTVQLDITGALQALAPNGKLPAADLLRVATSSATASGSCSGGRPRLTGASKVLGVSILGQETPVDGVVDQVVTLIDSSSIDPSGIDLSKVALPAPLNVLPLSAVQALVQPVLDALPAIPVPATLAQVKLTPGSQKLENGTLTQRGLGVLVSIAGQTLADLTLGQASVSQGDVKCGEDTLAGAQLQCTTRKLALIDVLQRNGYARLYGAADRRFVGKRVRIVSSWNGKTAAWATVAKDGTFQAKGKLPPSAIRSSNRARYQAQIGNERSLRLKLFRRMLVTKMASAKGKVTIAGRVVLPLGKPVQKITIKRRVSCTKSVTEKTLHPDSAGRFSVTLDGPPSGQAAVYRLATKVRKNARNAKLFPTFTLPRAVALK